MIKFAKEFEIIIKKIFKVIYVLIKVYLLLRRIIEIFGAIILQIKACVMKI